MFSEEPRRLLWKLSERNSNQVNKNGKWVIKETQIATCVAFGNSTTYSRAVDRNSSANGFLSRKKPLEKPQVKVPEKPQVKVPEKPQNQLVTAFFDARTND